MQDKRRGEGWVIVQIIMLAGVALLPYIAPTGWPEGLRDISRIAGWVIGGAGLIIIGIAALFLGGSLTIFPRPKDDGRLTQQGIYGLVRHPMYCGVILACLGAALASNNLYALLIALALIVFFDRKAAQEEVWLAQKYPEYPDYKRRVKKLIPWVY